MVAHANSGAPSLLVELGSLQQAPLLPGPKIQFPESELTQVPCGADLLLDSSRVTALELTC